MAVYMTVIVHACICSIMMMIWMTHKMHLWINFSLLDIWLIIKRYKTETGLASHDSYLLCVDCNLFNMVLFNFILVYSDYCLTQGNVWMLNLYVLLFYVQVLEVLEDVPCDQLLAEFTGKIMLRNEFNKENIVSKRFVSPSPSPPFLLSVPGIDYL